MGIFTKLGNKKQKLSPVVLVMYDGWGLAPPSHGNAITIAKTPTMDMFYKTYPHGELIAAGESVGLPAGEVGNSEVGHLTAGVGRTIYQSLKRINLSIENGQFFENKLIAQTINYAKQNKSNLHIMGLASSGNVHSNIDHLYALLQYCKKERFNRVYLHLFTDGRDAAPRDGKNVINQVISKIKEYKVGTIASLCGRYYAMDRDGRWERIQKVYEMMVSGNAQTVTDPIAAIDASYASGKTDEFVEPVIVLNNGQKPPLISDRDSVIYFNFRVDRARELSMAFTLPEFEKIKLADYGFDQKRNKGKNINSKTFIRTKVLNNVFFTTMVEYQKKIPATGIIFPPQEKFPDSVVEVLSKKGLKQLHLAESEKERMVTYYFRGMNSTPYPGEDIKIVPSPSVPTYDKKPEMSLPKIVKEFKNAVDRNTYSFFVMNFANPDMVAHSGDLNATIKAIEEVDRSISEVYKKILSIGGTLLISADHGNAEELLTFKNSSFFFTTEEGDVNTDHSFNPVPIIIINQSLAGQANFSLTGTLADIAPTILAIMKIGKPAAMTGVNLLAQVSTKNK